MTIHNIALKELEVLARDVLEGDHAIIGCAYNGLSTRIYIGTILNQLVEFVDVE